MPKRLLALSFFLISLTASPAWADGAAGFFVGLNNGNLSGDTPPNTSYKSRKGLIFGGFGEIRIARDVMLGLHPMYVQKGSTITQKPVTEDGEPIENDLALDYISVPILCKIETNNGATYFSGGLELAFLTKARLTLPDEEKDVKDLIQDLDLSMDFAFGGKIKLGSPFLTLELRYSQSLLNVADIQVEKESYSVPARFRSSGFQFLAGLLFPLGGGDAR